MLIDSHVGVLLEMSLATRYCDIEGYAQNEVDQEKSVERRFITEGLKIKV